MENNSLKTTSEVLFAIGHLCDKQLDSSVEMKLASAYLRLAAFYVDAFANAVESGRPLEEAVQTFANGLEVSEELMVLFEFLRPPEVGGGAAH